MKTGFKLAYVSLFISGALCVIPCLYAGKDFLDANWNSYSGFEVETEMVAPSQEVRPSLWFNENELKAFKAKLDDDETIRAYWEKVKHHRFLSSPFPEIIPDDQVRIPELAKANNRRIHQYYGEMTQIPLYCSFMAWMTDDPKLKQRYIERAKEALLRAYDGPIYDLDPRKDGVDKSVDEIYRGIWAQTICAAYDFIQPFLSKDEDHLIRERLLKEARVTYNDLETWAKGPHNHLSKPAWGLATFALTFSDEPDAKDWFRKAMEMANRNTRYFFSSDGIYREGYMYYVFSWLNYVPFLYHYKNVSGVDYFEDFKETFEWGIIGRNAKGWVMNIEDSFIRPVPTQMVAKAFENHRSFLAPEIPFSEILQWNFHNTDYKPFREIEKISGFNYTGATWDYPKELYELITYNPSIKASAPTADPTIFMQGGQSYFRNSWLNEPENQFYLLFHGVPQADNHDHHDTLSFVIYAKNQMMASDGGYTRSGYGDDMRYSYYRRPEAHNTITFDDIPLGDFMENQPNPSEDRLNTSFFDFEKKSAPFRRYFGESVGLAQRSIAFIQDEYFLVLDEVSGPDNGRDRIESVFKVYFHSGRSQLDQKGDLYHWNYEDDSYGSKATLITAQLSPNSEIEILDTEKTYIKSDYASFPSLKTTKVGQRALFGQILYPLGPDNEPPVIEDLSTEKLLAARIASESHTDVFLKSHSERKSRQGDIMLDGDFSWIRERDNKPLKAVAQSARYLYYKGSPLFASDKRVTLAVSFGDEIELGVALEELSKIRLQVDRPITSVSLDGKTIDFRASDGSLMLELEESGTYIIK